MRHHKPSGKAVVTIRLSDGSRKDVYLGPWRSAAAKREYNRIISELAAAGGSMPGPTAGTDVTIAELIARYRVHVEAHYRRADGTSTGQAENIRDSLRVLRTVYGHTRATDFGPLSLKACRAQMAESGLCRRTVNARVTLVRAFFKWCASEELLPASVAVALGTVKGLEKGRSKARESDPVKPPDADHIEAALPFMPPTVAARVSLQLLTGARPGELVALKATDIDRTQTPWAARLADHKTSHQGKPREILFGPAARELLAPWIVKAGDGFLFSPRAGESDRNAERRVERTTPRWPSHQKRRKVRRRRPPGDHYPVASYRRAVERACRKAGVPSWHPHQLRHAAATHLRAEFGIVTARVILGHSTAFTTEIYAALDREKATAAIEKVG